MRSRPGSGLPASEPSGSQAEWVPKAQQVRSAGMKRALRMVSSSLASEAKAGRFTTKTHNGWACSIALCMLDVNRSAIRGCVSYMLSLCSCSLQALKRVLRLPDAQVFSEPVSRDMAPDYHKVLDRE